MVITITGALSGKMSDSSTIEALVLPFIVVSIALIRVTYFIRNYTSIALSGEVAFFTALVAGISTHFSNVDFLGIKYYCLES